MPPKDRKASAKSGVTKAATSAASAKNSRSNNTSAAGSAPGRASRRTAKPASKVDEELDDAGEEQEETEVENSRTIKPEKAQPRKRPAAKKNAPLTKAQKEEEANLVRKEGERQAKRKREEDTESDHDDDEVAEPKQAPVKKPAARKAAAPKKSVSPKKPTKKPVSKKAKTSQEEDSQTEAPPAAKKARTEAQVNGAVVSPPAKAAARTRGPGARGAVLNAVPSTQFDVFVFGEGTSGELGLGSKKYEGKKPIDVRRPRINHNLKGVVAIACGGMHCVALTHDQRVLTWGVNDDKALGRDTHWEGGTRDIEGDEDSDDEDDTGMNPNESTPGPVDLSAIPEGTKISQVAATDSASFVVTDDGWVYGWGTFRGSDGIIGFSEGTKIQPSPILIPGLKEISRLACGSNHVLAMDNSGKVFTWGSGGQYQLGRKPLSRLGGPTAGLAPQPCSKFSKKHFAVHVGAGSYHSFYIDNEDRVWAWGLNNYAQTGLNVHTGEDDAMVLRPQIVQSLVDEKIRQIVGGEHHSVACTTDGKLLTWGRVDGHQVGHPSSLYTEENAVFDDNQKPRILMEPSVINDVKATFVAAGTDTSFAIDEAGKVYSWGFSANYQTGQGSTDDTEVPTVIDNTAIRDRKIVWAGAGGQFSMVAAEAAAQLTNGH
ncbi:RCC1/BLIP-II [Hypoxylon fragiforme]|uniref:RCC1/BLIP-II n=1 Tax=Hypoxylon fragiforme TaxID=63214 RepID=UPI0020C6F6C8|nr:RCC1/BLIP-II [Hypoxylon fragiforme]KAI2609679.1 RCC1/BLIP-II [Hypoxylon fragiforme]